MEPPIPPIQPEQKPPIDAQDAQAQAEMDALKQQRELDADEKRQDHQRREALRGVFAQCVRRLIALVFILVGTALSVVAWHYLGPSSLHWMSDDARETVSTVLFSGTLFVFLGLYVRDRVAT